MSILDIILIALGVIIVGIYAFIGIKKMLKFKKAVRSYIEQGLTLEQSTEKAKKEIYNKKRKDNEQDATFKD